MSVGSFLSSSFLVLGSTMSPPAGDAHAIILAQNDSAPAMNAPATTEGATILKRNEPTQVNGVEVVCTGIDSDTRADPRWNAYPLRLEFTAGGRAYISDETVTISGQGAPAIAVSCPAPWVLAKVAPGTYSVTAMVSGTTKHAAASVRKTGQARLVMRFPEVPAAESPNGEAGPNVPAPAPTYQPVPQQPPAR